MSNDIAQKVQDCAGDEVIDPRDWFDDPQDVADASDATYGDRLTVLQRWRSLAGADDHSVSSAIKSLEAGAVMGTDVPEGTPPDWGYAAKSDKPKT
jgi:hypothetical protein